MGSKLAGAITIPAGGWAITVETAAPASAATLAAGTYYPSGDGTPTDFFQELEDAINDGLAAELSASVCTVTVDSDGLVSIVLDAGTATVTWTDTEPRDICRLVGATTALSTTPAVGIRTAQYLVTSAFQFEEDRGSSQTREVIYEPDDGDPIRLGLSKRIDDLLLRVRYGGWRRDDEYGPYHAWEAFFDDVISPLLACRYYPDDTVTAAFVPVTQPYGYELGKITSPRRWQPEPWEEGEYTWWIAQLRMRLTT
jgi:hypothetical protein